MRNRLGWGSVVAAAVVFLGQEGFAQNVGAQSFNLERLTLNPAGRDGLLVGGGDVLEPSQVRFGLMLHYEHAPLVVLDDNTANIATLVGNRATAHLTAAFGIGRWFELGVQMPMVLWQGGANGGEQIGVVGLRASAFGSPWLQGRFGLFRERDGAPLDLSLDLLMNVPVGGPGAYTADADPSVLPRIGAARTLGHFVRLAFEIAGGVRTTSSFSSASPGAAVQSSSVLMGLGATTLGPGARFELSLRGTVPLGGQVAGAELIGGIRLPVGPIELQLLAGPGFGRLPGTPLFRVLAGASFMSAHNPGPVCVAGKPHEPVDCPELDLDGDGVPNAVDLCVRERGTADGCPDADGDGIADRNDACPKLAGLPQFAGCPDTDGDLVHDAIDRCVDVPGPVARQGCPPPDADRDGFADEDDKCPSVPGTDHGCPPDRDGDGVIDALDSCIDEPGTAENDGCPKKTLVKIEADRLVIREKVFFETGKAVILPRSFNLLDTVAKVLRSHPEVKKVFVDGHTDSRGKPERNQKLSLDRATSVRTYLLQAGVDASTLEARGFGPDRPLGDNKTAAGREQNRRVEFVIDTSATPGEGR